MVTPELKNNYKFMLAILTVVMPRQIPLSPDAASVVVVYTDASFEPRV